MRLLKPHWIHDKPIFSVDVHYSCLKFATGGQGNDSGRVVIWNLLPVLSEKAENDNSVPKILCQMDSHLACVNCVRWSQNGSMLASGSDDKLIMIWKMSKGPSGVFGTGGIQTNPENWKCISTLRGHAGDVLDLSWSPSPEDRWLASCSVDNTIIVWDVQSTPCSMVSVLKGHTGLVKGVAWDPVGKFLASQSDDRSLKIWKTTDWSCGRTITEPFDECGGTTHILRLSWSPDGQYLVSAHAMNGGGPVAQIIEREGWKCDKDFVGHRKAVTCVRFHNSILKRQAPKSNKSQQCCCLAIGSRDHSLSVWITALQRPLVVIHDLFQDSILDLSWGPEKCILLACSGDGTIACLQFSNDELGSPLSEDDKNAIYQRIYGKSANSEVHSSGRDMLIENADFLNSTSEKPVLPQLSDSTLKTPETINGSKEIPQSTNHFSSNNGNSQMMAPIRKQIETRTLDGKRRITPVFIPLSLDQEVSRNLEINSSSRNPENKSVRDTFAVPAPPTIPVITTSEQTRLDNRLTKTTSPSLPPSKSLGILKTSPIKYQPNQQQNSEIGRLNLQTTKGGQLEFNKNHQDYRVNLQNSNTKTSFGPLCRVHCWRTSSNEKLWETFIGSPVNNFCLCSKYVLLCSIDGTIRFLSIENGASVMPILYLSTAATQSTFCPLGKLAGIISECGQIRIWNIEKQIALITSTCSDIFKKSGQVIQFNITESGNPFVLLSNGNSYSYSQSMDCWLILNSKDPIIRQGLQVIPKDFQKNFQTYPLMTIQTSNRSGLNSTDLNLNNWQNTAKLLFIENQIKLSESIKSSEELKYWYSMLVYHLSINGSEQKLRLLLDELLGPAHGSGSSSQVKETILNIEKHKILENSLNILKGNPQWQRIYMEYLEQLNFIKMIKKTTLLNGEKVV